MKFRSRTVGVHKPRMTCFRFEARLKGAIMNLEEFHRQLADAPSNFQHELRFFLRNPTERNACYITGYIAALRDARLFKTDDAVSYWMTVIGSTERMPDVSRRLLGEMDNPPAVNGTKNRGPEMKQKIESILSQPGLERLKDWYSVSPAQRAALEEFLEAVVKECAEISYNSDESVKTLPEIYCIIST